MSFWIKVEVFESGHVTATTYSSSFTGAPNAPVRMREAATVSQVLRMLATAMVTAKAEIAGNSKEPT